MSCDPCPRSIPCSKRIDGSNRCVNLSRGNDQLVLKDIWNGRGSPFANPLRFVNRKRFDMRFERYDHRMGCVACQHDGKWWVVKPNGTAEQVASAVAAQTKAAHYNATATPEEREDWKN